MKYLPLLLLLPGVAVAAPLEVELGQRYDRLDNNYASWHSTYLNLSNKRGARQELYGTVRKVERFGMEDSEGMAGLVVPVGDQDSLTAEASFSPAHHILPSGSGLVQYTRQLPGHWSGNLGVRHSRYDPVSVNREFAGVEKYFSDYRVAYTFSESQLDGGGSSPSHSFAVNRYFNDTDMFGAIVAFGLEAERINPATLRVGHVHSATLLGRKAITSKLAATFSLGFGQQENAYDRWGASLGIRRPF